MSRKGKNRKKSNNTTTHVLTRETFGMTLLLFSGLVLLMLFTGSIVFAGIGKAVSTFMYGTFGYGSILLVAIIGYIGEWLAFGRKIKISVKSALLITLTAISAFLLFHAATSRNLSLDSFGAYISDCYNNASKGFSGYTFGGVVSALVVYPVAKITTFIGAYIIFSLLVIICGYFLFLNFKNRRRRRGGYSGTISSSEIQTFDDQPVSVKLVEVETKEPAPKPPVAIVNTQVYQPVQQKIPENNNHYSQKKTGSKLQFEKGSFAAENYRKNMIFDQTSHFDRPVTSEDYLSNFSSSSKSSVPAQSYGASYQDDILNQPATSTPANYVYGDKPVDGLGEYEQASGGTFPSQIESVLESEIKERNYSEAIERAEVVERAEQLQEPVNDNITEVRRAEPPVEVPPVDLRGRSKESERRSGLDRSVEIDRSDLRERSIQTEQDDDDSKDESLSMYNLFGPSQFRNNPPADLPRSTRRQEISKADIFDDDEDDDDLPDFTQKPVDSRLNERISAPEIKLSNERRTSREVNINQTPSQSAQNYAPAQEEKPKHIWKKYIRPGLDLLDDYPEHSNVNTGEIEDNKTKIIETLLKFKIESEVSNVIIGPAVTRYDVVILDKTKTMQSVKYKEAIAMALMKDNVTAYLNYSKGALSIEVPNNVRTVVGLKGMLASPKFLNCKPNSITFALGKNVEGEVMCADITRMPHLLIAGTTGSGKSICLSALIVSLLYKYGPEELRFILVDPKQVEFISYDKLPHLMINEIIYDVDKAIKALNWAIKEMERRYSLFKEMTEKGVATKNLDEYNAHLPAGEEKLPKIVIILDEFGDLMLQAKKDIEGRIIKLVQKARACGIHLILATQRPSVDCITGLIKSNLPTRIGFKVNSFDDARTIFDIGGAEKLLGKGDMYFRSAENPELARIQGCFIDTPEVQRVTDFIKAHNETYFDQSVSDFINTVEEEETSNPMMGDENTGDGGDMKIDDTYVKALYYCVVSNQASVSMIQRRFPVGYIKACKIIDWMENMNYVTQSEGSKPRKVLLSKEEFLNTYGEVDD